MATIRISGKCDDRFSARIGDDDAYEGYVLSGIGIGGGDYINMEIDLETGMIVGWKPISVDEIVAIMDDTE